MKINKEKLEKFIFNKYTLNIGVILVGALGIYLMLIYRDYCMKKENEEYKMDLVDIHTKLDGYVVDYSWSKANSGTKLVTLSTGDKFFTYVPSTNYAYNRGSNNLFDCLNEGDHLYKPANTDSIFVTKPDGTVFFFIAFGVINVKSPPKNQPKNDNIKIVVDTLKITQ